MVHDREEVVEGAIAIQPLRRNLPGFDEYFKNLMGTRNERNPWFEEFLQTYYNCTNDPEDVKGTCIWPRGIFHTCFKKMTT